jgi:hypothetical protein
MSEKRGDGERWGINFKKIKHPIKFGFNQNLYKFTKRPNEIDRKENTFKT